MEVVEKLVMIEWLANNYKTFGCALEIITDRSQEGSQFCSGFGGIGGILRYRVDFAAMDNEDLAFDDVDLDDYMCLCAGSLDCCRLARFSFHFCSFFFLTILVYVFCRNVSRGSSSLKLEPNRCCVGVVCFIAKDLFFLSLFLRVLEMRQRLNARPQPVTHNLINFSF